MKIYTRKGDSGETSLIGGTRVPKDDKRVEAYGTIDELVAFLAIARVEALSLDSHFRETFISAVDECQEALMRLCAQVASGAHEHLAFVTESDVKRVESTIDQIEELLTPLSHFVLPGQSRLEAALHVARTVCRRAERRVVALRDANLNVGIMYLNRLSDLLFVLARLATKAEKCGEERLWRPSAKQSQ